MLETFGRPPGSLEAGYLEMLSRQMTQDSWQAIRDTFETGRIQTLISKGVLVREDRPQCPGGLWDTSGSGGSDSREVTNLKRRTHEPAQP